MLHYLEQPPKIIVHLMYWHILQMVYNDENELYKY
jgi:hypothetical protein